MTRAVEEAEALLNMGAAMLDAGTLRAVLAELDEERRRVDGYSAMCAEQEARADAAEAERDALRAQLGQVRAAARLP